jgi:hypothetical protein
MFNKLRPSWWLEILIFYLFAIFFLLYSVNGAIITRGIEKFDKQTTLGTNVELSCELTDYYASEVQWRKLEGVCYIITFENSISSLILSFFLILRDCLIIQKNLTVNYS